jgi:hypothetical protein
MTIYLEEYVTMNVAFIIRDKTSRNIHIDDDNLRIIGEKRVKRTNTPRYILLFCGLIITNMATVRKFGVISNKQHTRNLCLGDEVKYISP